MRLKSNLPYDKCVLRAADDCVHGSWTDVHVADRVVLTDNGSSFEIRKESQNAFFLASPAYAKLEVYLTTDADSMGVVDVTLIYGRFRKIAYVMFMLLCMGVLLVGGYSHFSAAPAVLLLMSALISGVFLALILLINKVYSMLAPQRSEIAYDLLSHVYELFDISDQ
jgi:hypothetical protein